MMCVLQVTVDNFFMFSGTSNATVESAMMNYTLSTGPISVCLDASEWDSYTGGVVRSCGDAVDHCVQIVGLSLSDSDDDDDEGSSSSSSSGNDSSGSSSDGSGSGVWKVRNSWGADWGVDVYIYLEAGVNLCGITSIASTTTPSFV